MTDVAIRLEQNFADGVFELLRAIWATHDGELFAVPADVCIPNIFQNLTGGAAALGYPRQRPRLHPIRLRASPDVRQQRYVASSRNADHNGVLQIQRSGIVIADVRVENFIRTSLPAGTVNHALSVGRKACAADITALKRQLLEAVPLANRVLSAGKISSSESGDTKKHRYCGGLRLTPGSDHLLFRGGDVRGFPQRPPRQSP